MILIYRFSNADGAEFLIAARGAGQARQRAIMACGHSGVQRLDNGERSGLDGRYAIAFDGSAFIVTFCNKHIGRAGRSMDALACAIEYERQRWRYLTDTQLQVLTCDAINADVKAGRASWADARRYADLWNKHKLSTSATVVDGVVCIVDGAP